VQGRTERLYGFVVASARSIEQSESEHHAAPATMRESMGLPLGDEGRPQDRRDVADGRGLRRRTICGVHERDRRLYPDHDLSREGGIDEDFSTMGKPRRLAPVDESVRENMLPTYAADMHGRLGQGADARPARTPLLGHPSWYYITRALIWTLAILAVSAPLAVTKYRRA
jgi:hypothetical protein